MEIIQKKYDVIRIRVADVKVSGLNPVSRTAIRATDGLLESMRKYGWIDAYPIKLSHDGYVGDGHRRLACAKKLGINEITAIRTDYTVAQLISFNQGTRQWNQEAWDAVAVKGVEVSAGAKQAQTLLEKLAGPDALEYVRDHGKSAAIGETLNRFLRYVNRTGDPIFGKKALCWIVEWNQGAEVKNAIKDLTEPQLLIDAVRNNRRLRRSGWRI